LLYDALCPICARSVGVLRRLGLLERAEARPIDEAEELGLPPEEVERLRSGMLLVWRASGELARGFDALVRLLELHGRLRRLVAVLRVPPLRALGRAGYAFVASNRRILSPPATGGAACACDPPFHLGARAALLVALALLAFGLPAVTGGTRFALFWAAGGVSAAVVGAAAAPRRAAAVLWQSLAVLALGASVLAPLLFLGRAAVSLGAPGPLVAGWIWLAAILSAAVVLRSATRRCRALGLPAWLPGAWAGLLLATLGAALPPILRQIHA
ncbi:MAG: DUF393 domain-containing protein, partial [Planctomycetes bacterium]|nr:DUF393 domain-containing protein [Planctomycetota bacterium]